MANGALSSRASLPIRAESGEQVNSARDRIKAVPRIMLAALWSGDLATCTGAYGSVTVV
jgi:hypothetical protein